MLISPQSSRFINNIDMMRSQTSNNEFEKLMKKNKEMTLNKNMLEHKIETNTTETVENLLNKMNQESQKGKESLFEDIFMTNESPKNYYNTSITQPPSRTKSNLGANHNYEEDDRHRNITISKKLSIGECFVEGMNPKMNG